VVIAGVGAAAGPGPGTGQGQGPAWSAYSDAARRLRSAGVAAGPSPFAVDEAELVRGEGPGGSGGSDDASPESAVWHVSYRASDEDAGEDEAVAAARGAAVAARARADAGNDAWDVFGNSGAGGVGNNGVGNNEGIAYASESDLVALRDWAREVATGHDARLRRVEGLGFGFGDRGSSRDGTPTSAPPLRGMAPYMSPRPPKAPGYPGY